jgi:hypothetical protein
MFASVKPLIVLSTAVAMASTLAAAPPAAVLPDLSRQALAGWDQYVEATRHRIDVEMAAAPKFLALDFASSAAVDRAAVLAGAMPVAEAHTTRPGGGAIEVPDAWVHHWRGAVLIPKVTLDQVFARLETSVPGTGRGDVIASQIRARNGDALKVFIKVQRQVHFVTAFTFVYNTEHDVRFTRRDPSHGSSVSIATKIAEVADNGTPGEHENAAGDDKGFLWRWNSYWRYEQVAAGVIAECESITLSRTAPFGTGFIASHFERGEAPASMTRALVNLREHFAATDQTPRASSPVR